MKVLQEIEAGARIASVARAHGIGDKTIYAWRERYQGMTKSDLAQMRALLAGARRYDPRDLLGEGASDDRGNGDPIISGWELVGGRSRHRHVRAKKRTPTR